MTSDLLAMLRVFICLIAMGFLLSRCNFKETIEIRKQDGYTCVRPSYSNNWTCTKDKE